MVSLGKGLCQWCNEVLRMVPSLVLCMTSLQKEKKQVLSVDDTEIGGMPLDVDGYF